MLKRIWLLLPLVLLLSGCGGTEEEAGALQQRYGLLESAQAEAEIICHLPGESRSFTVTTTVESEGATTTIRAPEEVAGLSATVSGEDLLVNYQGAAIASGLTPVLSPANCVPYLLRAAGDGYLLEHGRETIDGMSCLRLSFDTTASDGEKIVCTVWFEEESGVPCYGEFSRDGAVVMTVRIQSFEMTGKEA